MPKLPAPPAGSAEGVAALHAEVVRLEAELYHLRDRARAAGRALAAAAERYRDALAARRAAGEPISATAAAVWLAADAVPALVRHRLQAVRLQADPVLDR